MSYGLPCTAYWRPASSLQIRIALLFKGLWWILRIVAPEHFLIPSTWFWITARLIPLRGTLPGQGDLGEIMNPEVRQSTRHCSPTSISTATWILRLLRRKWLRDYK